jgi:hypothetical protein
MQEQPIPRNLFRVAQFAQRWTAWSQPALRNLILHSADRLNSRGERIPGNGLAEIGAVVRVGRRVLLDEQKFFEWIAAQQVTGASCAKQRLRRRQERAQAVA